VSQIHAFASAVTQVSCAGNRFFIATVFGRISDGRSVLRTFTVIVVLLMLQGCTAMVVGTAVGVATTVAVETAKVPFKVTGAVIDVATDDEDD
jgi:ABC-type methionine transport system permease subunit